VETIENLILTEINRQYQEKLHKYKDEFRQVVENEFPISDETRANLKTRQQDLGLRDEDVETIENLILTEINRQYQEKLHKYKDKFRQAVESEFPISDETRANLKTRQQDLGLRDEDVETIENPILAEINRHYQEKLHEYENEFRQEIKRKFRVSAPIRAKLKNRQQTLKLRNEDVEKIEKRVLDERNSYLKNIIPFLAVGLVAVIAGSLVTQWRKTPNLEQEISLGEDILLAQSSSDKEEGVKAFAKNDFDNAIKSFQSSLSQHPDDPEALIYKNNAEAAKTKSDLKIAVSIPIGTNLNVATEILRGVAQAQNELNQKQGGFNGKKLWVAIANDNNNPEDAKNIATEFVTNSKYSSVLAVVGHNSSEASLAARDVYRKGSLVMISPTSDADKLPNDSPIFHTMPTLNTVVKELSEHAKKAGVTKIVICYDSQAQASGSFKDKFVEAFGKAGVVQTDCNLSKINSDSEINTILEKANQVKANGLLVVPGVRNTIDKAIRIAAAAKQKNLKLFGSSTLNTYQTLEQGQGIEGMMVAVPWNPKAEIGKNFAIDATKLWGKNVDWRTGNLTWRTAMAYDATQAIIQGINTWEQEQDKPRREWLTNQLASKNFSVEGVTGKVSFGGDRNGEVSLLQLKSINITVTGYDIYPE
ncbi:ABC transporter substrate-binding protein, partial [Microcoleus sp. B6-A1]|uniref:ABC transporter substrate-binding protein n=1 Tax=Microcoleus sp. B6-A1 TaxID=2818684 RepID=UPI002FD32E27